MEHGYRAVLIAGPTASGKSAFAIELAKRLKGVIINADSMQLYREMRIVSARPSLEDEALAAHRLYGVLPASHACSTGEWLGYARQEIERARGSGFLPILVGGTGLYFKALCEGFAEIPSIRPELREKCRGLAEEGGLEAVREALLEKDPVAAESLQDLQRLTRALEVVEGTGRTLLQWQQDGNGEPVVPVHECARIVLEPPRSWLHQRIALRSDLMLSDEGIAEIEALLALKLPDTLPAMRAIGVKEVDAYLRGEVSLAATVERLTVATRQYAKRQETWFRNQMSDWTRMDPSVLNSAEMADAFWELS